MVAERENTEELRGSEILNYEAIYLSKPLYGFQASEVKLDCFFLHFSQKPQNGFLLIPSIASGVDSYCRKFAALAPALDGERGYPQEASNFFYG